MIKPSALLLLTGALATAAGCTSWDTVQLNGDTIHIPTMKSSDGKKDIASTAALYLQETCLEFDLFFIPMGTTTPDCLKAFMDGFQKSGHDRVAQLNIVGPANNGIFAIGKLFGFRSSVVTGIAVDTNENAGGGGGAATP